MNPETTLNDDLLQILEALVVGILEGLAVVDVIKIVITYHEQLNLQTVYQLNLPVKEGSEVWDDVAMLRLITWVQKVVWK